MPALIRALLRQVLLPQLLLLQLLLLMQMRCSCGQPPSQAMQQLLQLNQIVTDRINDTLQQLRNQTASEEFLRQYERLEMAAALPVDQLDAKIRSFYEFLAYEQARRQLAQDSVTGLNRSGLVQQPRVDLQDSLSFLLQNETRAESYSAFEKRVLKLLRKLGVYDPFAERVFKAIFSDEKQLRKLKKKLQELDDDDEEQGCSLWDFVFGLF